MACGGRLRSGLVGVALVGVALVGVACGDPSFGEDSVGVACNLGLWGSPAATRTIRPLPALPGYPPSKAATPHWPMPAAPPLRLRHYDYSTPGAYLITITTARRSPSFGKLTSHGVALSPLGELVASELARTAAIRREVLVDAVAIMPDHLHCILMLTHRGYGGSNVSRIVNGLKAAVTARYCTQCGDPAARVWQRGFHDRVIRSDRALNAARRYVLENAARAWLKQGDAKAAVNTK